MQSTRATLPGRDEPVHGRALGGYYSFAGPYAEQIVSSAAKDPDAIRGYLAAYAEAGCDEVICFPSSADPDQVDLLARAAL